ncbi:asparagine synthase (glutamine-hydrolyzing) [Polaribacter batillariae]|uniref:asparagine synthase (glutamine-hydrolyzing) n=1 Tax=Polaribacter batillariae TaxID=2808900 RepID=A0ABX7STJ2_9FLAO|nr:asparagine synthase (glutamine-hydrolyzing) [Polaribacter batillariae]QTD37567.1 asparagine synthase (glutamine-hydrolyzing) [Polaribacter batillariae]
MCGIVGLLGNIEDGEILLDKMLVSQHHRGPDFTGKFISDSAKLGHNRLSILDLSENANQPFISNCKRYILVFNGEIYNYLEIKEELLNHYNFKTNSDTEVLLASFIVWKKDCLQKLNGMFSFAIYDTEKETLFAARDRFGVKPFYYFKKEEKFIFSSEIKALFISGIVKKANEKVWASYFAYGSYGLPNETFWKDIQQLPAGHYLEYKNKNLQVFKWYFFENEIKKHQQKKSFNVVKEEYKTLLKDSIKLRFRADVTIGFNISGGLDSSTLLALVNKIEGKEKIKAYTFYTNDKRYDELPWVEEMISLTKNPLEKIILEADINLKDKIENIAHMQDEPYGGIPTVAYSEIFKKARKDNVLVLLDGQGMDEQWAGYDYYLKNNNATIQGTKSSPFRKNALTKEFLQKAVKPKYPEPFKDAVLNKQYRDLFYTKIPRALRFNDRISMGYSTELREPFLDFRLVEYAFAQPLEYKINKTTQKYLLREIVSEYLSDSITYAPKRPLQTPQREWLGEELFNDVENYIEQLKDSKVSNWFNFTELDKLLKEYKQGDKDSSFYIWQWINLAMLVNN